ncbi:hypothetical protein [Nocardia tengchongensis]
MSSAEWPVQACLLAHEIQADRIVFESNYGGDMAKALITQAWDALQREGDIPRGALCPYVRSVHSRRNKMLRAEPVARAVITGRIGFGAHPSLQGPDQRVGRLGTRIDVVARRARRRGTPGLGSAARCCRGREDLQRGRPSPRWG